MSALAAQLTGSGAIVLVSAISPRRAPRYELRQRIGAFLEAWARAPLAPASAVAARAALARQTRAQ